MNSHPGTERRADAKMISHTFFRLLPIQFILVAVGSINSIVDGTISGRLLGPTALAIIGLYFPILKLIDVISAVLQGGAQILCGRFLGKNEVERTGQVFSLDILVSLVVSVLLMAVCQFFTEPVVMLISREADMYDGLALYIRGILFAFPAQIIGSQLSGFLQLEKQEKRTYAAIVAMAVLNVSMNILFVRVFQLGIFGIGLSTSVSTWCFMLIQLSYYFTGRSAIRIDLKSIVPSDLLEIIKIGGPGAITHLCQVIRAVYLNAMLHQLSGSDAVAAYAATGSFSYIFFAATAAIASATRLLASVYYGEEDRTGLLYIMRTALYKGIALVTVLSIGFSALAYPFALCFSSDTTSEFFKLSVMFFRAFPLSMPLSTLCMVYITYYQSAGRLSVVNVLSVVDGVVGIVVSVLILSPFLGVASVAIAQISNGLFPPLIIFIFAWYYGKKPPLSLEESLILPEDFGIPDDDRLDITVRGMEEVLHTSEELTDFCNRHQIKRRQSYFSGLCVEEMAGNIVRYGFSDGKKHSVDIRIAINRKQNRIIIRLKDDCSPFDPKERAALFTENEDPFRNIGIRMIERISDSMEYGYILGLNVLTVTLSAEG